MAFSIDSSTLEHAANGDSAALRSLVTTLRPRIEKQLLRYPLAEEDRRDLAQATLMQVIRRVGSFQPRLASRANPSCTSIFSRV